MNTTPAATWTDWADYEDGPSERTVPGEHFSLVEIAGVTPAIRVHGNAHKLETPTAIRAAAAELLHAAQLIEAGE